MRNFIFGLFLVMMLSLSVSYPYASAVIYDGTKAGIMLTFEHATSDQLTAIEANLADMVGTMSPISQRIGSSGYITQQQLLDLQESGFEISSHSATHEEISSSTSSGTLYEEIVQSKIDLENMGFQVNGYVWPFNIVTNDAFDLVQSNYLWTTFYDPISYNPQRMDLSTINFSFQTYGIYHEHSQGIGNGYVLNSFSKVKNEIDFAIANNLLVGFKFHAIENGSNTFSTSPAMFADIIDYMREQRDLGNLDVLTRSQGLGFENGDTTTPTSIASPPAGTFESPQLVTLTANESGIIYYTIDGTTPTTSSNQYNSPISIPNSSTLMFFAVDESGNQETVNIESYDILNPGSNVIPFDSSGNAVCSSSPCSIPITVSPGNNRMIIVVSTAEGPISLITSIDNTGGTDQGILVGTEQIGLDGALQRVEMWRIMESDIVDGTNTVTVYFDTTPSDAGVSLMSFSGVAQKSAETIVSNVVTSSPDISAEITALTDNSLIISAVGNGQTGGSYTNHGDGQIERHSFAIPSAWHVVTTEVKPIAGLDVQSHTYSISSIRQAQVVASFAPAPDIDKDGIPDELDTENIIDSSITLSESYVLADVIIQDGAILTIPNGITLTITSGNNITVEFGSGVLIKSGGTLQVNS